MSHPRGKDECVSQNVHAYGEGRRDLGGKGSGRVRGSGAVEATYSRIKKDLSINGGRRGKHLMLMPSAALGFRDTPSSVRQFLIMRRLGRYQSGGYPGGYWRCGLVRNARPEKGRERLRTGARWQGAAVRPRERRRQPVKRQGWLG